MGWNLFFKSKTRMIICYYRKHNYHVDQSANIGCSEHFLLQISLHQKQNYHQKIVYLVLRKSGQADLASC